LTNYTGQISPNWKQANGQPDTLRRKNHPGGSGIYQGVDIGQQIHGWLVDDVSITGVPRRQAVRLLS